MEGLEKVGNKRQTVSFMLSKESATVQAVKRSAKEDSHYPLMEEYDFKNDHKNPLLTIDLRPSTRIRVRFCFLIALNAHCLIFVLPSHIKRNVYRRCSAMDGLVLVLSCCRVERASP